MVLNSLHLTQQKIASGQLDNNSAIWETSNEKTMHQLTGMLAKVVIAAKAACNIFDPCAHYEGGQVQV